MGHWSGEMEFEFQEGDGSFVPAGKTVNFIKNHLGRSEVDEAVRLYQSCKDDFGEELLADAKGRGSAYIKNLGQMFMKARDFKRAGQCLMAAGDHENAAKLFEQSYQFKEAAELYAAGQLFDRAAAVYERASMFEQALAMYLKISDFAHASECLVKMSRPFEAGQLLIKAGNQKGAIEILRRIPAHDEKFIESRLILGELASVHGYKQLALKFYLEAANLVGVNERSVEMFYRAGLLAAELGLLDHARKLYKIVLATFPDYKDAADRLARAAAGEVPSAGAAGAIPAMPTTAPQGVSGAAAAKGDDVEPEGGLVEVMKDFEYLKKLPLFAELSLEEMKKLYGLCDEATFSPGDVLIEQGKTGRALYIVRGGLIDILRSDGFAESLLAELGKGAYVGEMSLLEEAPTSAKVVAKNEVSAFRIDRQKFQHLLEADDRLAVKIFREFSRELSARLREANRKLGSGA